MEVFPGNTADPLALGPQLPRLKEQFGLQRVIVVGDRGMMPTTRIADLERYGWIKALQAQDIQRLAATFAVPVGRAESG